MDSLQESTTSYICQICSNRVQVRDPESLTIDCERCGHKHQLRKEGSARLTLVFTITALILYIPANLFPFMSIELYGNRNTSTIWEGIVSLYDDGSWPIAAIIFLASLLIPFCKLVILFYLSIRPKVEKHPLFKTKLYNFVEAIGRWSMLDIFLLAVLVAIMKLGPWTTVQPEPGSYMFALVVIFTMLASTYFEPQLLWNEHNGKN